MIIILEFWPLKYIEYPDFGTWYLILLGATAVIVMLKTPKGIWGIITKHYDLRFFPVQRRLKLKSHE